MSDRNKLLDGVKLAAATGLGEWSIYGIKKANKIFHRESGEALIFTGRYSTPAKITKWIDAHPDFVARHILVKDRPAKDRARQAARRAQRARPQHQVA